MMKKFVLVFSIALLLISFTSAFGFETGFPKHNNLKGIQGTGPDFFHLNSSQYSALSDLSSNFSAAGVWTDTGTQLQPKSGVSQNIYFPNFTRFATNACDDTTVLTPGDLCFNSDHDTLTFATETGQNIDIGREISFIGKNREGSFIADGSVVAVIGAFQNQAAFVKADGTNLSRSIKTAVLTKDCNDNAACPVTTYGVVHGLDTSMWNENDTLYLSATTPGNLSNTPPTLPNNPVWVATVLRVHATEGEIFVDPRFDPSDGFLANDGWFTNDITIEGQARIGTSPYYSASRALKIYDDGVQFGARMTMIGTGDDSQPAIEFVTDGNQNKRTILLHRGETNNDYGLWFATTNNDVPAYTMALTGDGNLGVGTTFPVNKLDIEGSAAIGAAYSGTSTAPSNSLIVQDYIGVGTDTPEAWVHVYKDSIANKGTIYLDQPTAPTGSTTKGPHFFMASGGTDRGFIGFFDSETHGNGVDLNLKATGRVALGAGSFAEDGDVFVETFGSLTVGNYWDQSFSADDVYTGVTGFQGISKTPKQMNTVDSSSLLPGETIGLSLHNNNTTPGAWAPLFMFSKTETGSTPYNAGIAAIGAMSPTGTGASNNWIDGEMAFFTGPTGGSGLLERMRIHENGNITMKGNLSVEDDIQSNGIDIWNGYYTIAQGTPAIQMGGDVGLNTRTDNTRKLGAITQVHYDNDEEPYTVFAGDANSAYNRIQIGGGFIGYNAATEIVFNTAGNTTTLTGTERMKIDTNGDVDIITGNLDVQSGTLDVSGNADVGGDLHFERFMYADSNQRDFIIYANNGENILRGLDGWTGTFNDSAITNYFQVGRTGGNTAFSSFNGAGFNRLAYIVQSGTDKGVLFTPSAGSNAPPKGYFEIRDASANTDFLVETDGDVGIGTDSPVNKLDVEGGMSVGASYSGTSTAPTNGLIVEGSLGVNTDDPDYLIDVQGAASTQLISSEMGFNYNTVGIPPAPTGVTSAGGSVDDGQHYYWVTYYTGVGESGRSASTATVTTGGGSNTVTLTIPVSDDPRVIGRNIYRTEAGDANFQDLYLTTVANNVDTEYIDTAADSTLTGTKGMAYYRPDTTSYAFRKDDVNALIVDERFTALGLASIPNNLEGGGRSVHIGPYTGYSTTSGKENTFIGERAGYSDTTGGANIGIGAYAGSGNQAGNSNIIVGDRAAQSTGLKSYNDNILVGTRVGYYIEDAEDDNTIIGSYSRSANTTNGIGLRNTMIGYRTGYNGAGDDNVFLGHGAGYYEQGSNKLYIDSTSTTTPLIWGDFVNDRVGIGGVNAVNTLDVEGAVAIGAGVSGTSTASTNGLLVEGNIESQGSIEASSAGYYANNNLVFQQNSAVVNFGWVNRGNLPSSFTSQFFSGGTGVTTTPVMILNGGVGILKTAASGIALDVNGDSKIDGDLNVTGNTTITVSYAEAWGVDIGEVEIASSGVYYPVTNWTDGMMNGHSFDGENLTVETAGIYSLSSTWSFSGTANNEYHIAVAVDGVVQDKCHAERVIGTGGDVGSAGITCLLSVDVGDILTLVIENVDSAGNPTIHNINANMFRIGG